MADPGAAAATSAAVVPAELDSGDVAATVGVFCLTAGATAATSAAVVPAELDRGVSVLTLDFCSLSN